MAARTDPAMARAKWSKYKQGAVGASHMIALDVNRAFVEGMAVATAKTSKQLTALGRAVAKGAVSNNKTAQINRRIAVAAKNATVNSYVAYRRKGVASYRQGEGRHPRDSGGALRDALRSEKMIHSDATTISFINKEHLNASARQWARLNYGAGPRGMASPQSRPFPMRVSNTVVADIGIGGRPSRAFTIPRGYFIEGAFYLPGEGPHPGQVDVARRSVTQGIRAEHFLDNGLAMIARRFWPEYERHLATLTKLGVTSVKVTNTVTTNKVKAKPPRPSRAAADARSGSITPNYHGM